MKNKELGKISKAEFGLGGYQGCCIGLHLTIEGKGWGCGRGKDAWDSRKIKCSEHSKWTEADRSKSNDDIVRYVSELLDDAKVTSVSELVGVPVEVETEGINDIIGFRILTEVL